MGEPKALLGDDPIWDSMIDWGGGGGGAIKKPLPTCETVSEK